MTLALRSPDLVSAIVSVDNAPINAPLSNDFAKYIRGMKEIEGANVTKQREADEILQPYEPVRFPSMTSSSIISVYCDSIEFSSDTHSV